MLRIDRAAIERLPLVLRDEARGLLETYEELLRANPLHGYQPHEKQVVFHGGVEPAKAFLGGNRCIAGGEFVRMADGSSLPICEVVAGDWVMGADETGAAFPVRVLERIANGIKPVSTWVFGKRESMVRLVATGDHRVLAAHEKRGVPELVSLGEIAAPRSRSRWSACRAAGWSPELVPLGGEKWALMFGMLLGDGCVSHRRPTFACADDATREVFVAECAKHGLSVHRNSANPVQHTVMQRTVPKASRDDGGRFLAGSRNEFLDVLQVYGIDEKAHNKRIPKAVWDWSNEAVGRLLAGLLMTDGSVWKASEGSRAGFTSVSESLAEGVRRLLADRFGVYGSRLLVQHRAGRRTEYSFTIGNYWSLRRLYDQVPLWGSKRAKLRDALDGWEGKRSDAARMRFRSREDEREVETYDLHVDHPAHLFVMENGLIVSNSGKTTAGILDDLIQAVDAECVPEHLRPFKTWTPPFYCRVVTPDFTSTMEGVIFQKLRDWCPRGQLVGDSWGKAYDKQRRRLSFKNGSWFEFMTFEQDLDKFGGAALHRVHYDEEPPRLIRQECLMRLIDFGGDELFTMTPLHGMSWMFDEFYDPWERGVLEDATVVVVDMDDNPHLDEKTKRRVLAGLSDEERAARKSGRFVHFAGLVYGEFRRQLHVVPEGPVPAGATVVAAIDPGVRHMAAVVWAYLTHDDDLVVFEEVALTGATVREVANACKRVESKHKLGRPLYVIDPAAANRSHQTGRSDQMEYLDNGIVTILGQNSVTAGINRVKERLQVQPVPKLHVMANCGELIDEFRRYRWTTPSRSEHDAKEQVVKRDDHLLDALRYLVMSRPYTATRVREERFMTPAERALRDDMSGRSWRRRKGQTPQTDMGSIYA